MNKTVSILLVEDDINIRNYLTKIINESSDEFVVAEVADNGLTGLNIAKKLMPDIIITDIFMPVMNGFEMLEALFDMNFSVIVLSGYDDFQYMQTAIRLGVHDYLLKPICEEDLFNALNSAKSRISHKTELNDSALLSIRTHYVHDLFSSNSPASAQVFTSLLKNSKYPYYALIYIECDDKQNSYDYVNKLFASPEIIDFHTNSFFVVVNSPNIFTSSNLSEQFSELTSARIGICVSKTETDNVIDMIFTAYRCVEYQKLFGCNHIVYDDKLPKKTTYINSLYESFNSLYNYISDNNTDACDACFDRLFADAFFFNDFNKFKMTLIRFVFHLENKYSDVAERVFKDVSIDSFDGYFELKNYIKKIANNIICEKSNESNNYHRVVRDAISLIRDDYAEVTIKRLAEQLFISPSYLMYLFKQDTGYTLNNYIISYRIDKACELFKSGKKIYEVSELVGYKSVKFFSTTFKEHIGVTPREYIKQEC